MIATVQSAGGAVGRTFTTVVWQGSGGGEVNDETAIDAIRTRWAITGSAFGSGDVGVLLREIDILSDALKIIRARASLSMLTQEAMVDIFDVANKALNEPPSKLISDTRTEGE